MFAGAVLTGRYEFPAPDRLRLRIDATTLPKLEVVAPGPNPARLRVDTFLNGLKQAERVIELKRSTPKK